MSGLSPEVTLGARSLKQYNQPIATTQAQEGIMEYQPLDHEYDEVPYPHISHGQTHPDNLAAIGALLGLDPAPPDRCRVLELGCARGGNLIPMAYALPNSQFLGIDYSAHQIALGKQDISQLNLENISLERVDILDFPAGTGQFDFIIAHGVYSWVPEAVRDGLLRICRDHLAEQGIAFVSYNTYPGWNMLNVVREMMLYATQKLDDPMEIASRGQEMVHLLADGIPKSFPAYKAYFQSYQESNIEKREVKGGSTAQLILHDELATINQPVYFHQFAHHAAQYDLQYLAEATFSSVMPNEIDAEIVKKLESYSENLIEFEQYLDFLKNRSFRRTLLCHESTVVKRNIRAEAIMSLRIASRADSESDSPDLSPKVIETFAGKDGATFKSDHPLSKAAFQYLREMQPLAIPFDELFQQAKYKLPPGSFGIEQQEKLILAASILQAYTYSDRLVEIHAVELPFTIEISAKPRATEIARWAIANNLLVTNARHERVEMDQTAEKIVEKLDGSHSIADLLDWLFEQHLSGNLSLGGDAEMLSNPDDYKQLIEVELKRILAFLSRAALLEA